MADRKIPKSRKPPVKIPLPFDEAVGGLLAVDPKKVKAAAEAERKKSTKQKRSTKQKG